MKLAAIRPNDVGVVRDESFIAIGAALAREGLLPTNASMIDLIARYDDLKKALPNAVDKAAAQKLDSKHLRPPVQNPSKIWAAATNYKRGSAGLNEGRGRGTAGTAAPGELLERIFFEAAVGDHRARGEHRDSQRR